MTSLQFLERNNLIKTHKQNFNFLNGNTERMMLKYFEKKKHYQTLVDEFTTSKKVIKKF